MNVKNTRKLEKKFEDAWESASGGKASRSKVVGQEARDIAKQRKRQNGTQEPAPSTRPVGRPKKRWEDEIFKPEETEETKGNEIKNNDTWIKVATSRKRWTAVETEYAVAAASLHRLDEGRAMRPMPGLLCRARTNSVRLLKNQPLWGALQKPWTAPQVPWIHRGEGRTSGVLDPRIYVPR